MLVLFDLRLLAAWLGGHGTIPGLFDLGSKLLVERVILSFTLETFNAVIAMITAVGAGEDVIQALVMALDGPRGKHWARIKS